MWLRYRLLALVVGLSVAGNVFAGEFEEALKAAGIPDESLPRVVEILKKHGYVSVQDLSELDPKDVEASRNELGGRNANRLLEKFGKKAVDVLALPELLQYLLVNPQDAKALKALQRHEEVKNAESHRDVNRRTEYWAVVTDDNQLDVQNTLRYLEFLQNSPPKSDLVYRGKTLTSIYKLGLVTGVLFEHPILDEQLGKDGIDSKGFDWLKVSVDVRKALLWAKNTKNEYFPLQPQKELRTYYQDALENKGNVQDIVKAYKAALQNKDPYAVAAHNAKLPE